MFEELFKFVDETMIANVAKMSVKMIEVITPLMAILVVVYAIYLAYKALYDSQNMMVMESIKFMGALALVCTVALNVPWYLNNIVPIVTKSGDGIVNALLNPNTGSTAGTLQSMSDHILAQINAIWQSIDISLLSGASFADATIKGFQIFFLILTAIPFLAICTAYLLVAKIMVSLLLIVGPLFIMFSFFPSTRDFFKAWTGQCFNYILLSILFPISFTFFDVILDKTIFDGALTTAKLLSSWVLYFVMCFVAVQIPTLASSLSGGMGINGLVGNMSGTLGALNRIGTKPKKDKDPEPPKPTNKNNVSPG